MADSDGSSQLLPMAAAWADVSHALGGFYELADILIVLDEVPLLEISNLDRQLKFSPEIGDDHPIIGHLTASLWFRGMDLAITSSTSKSRGPSNERKNVAAAEKQLEAMVYRLTQERGRWPFLTPRLENATDKTRESVPPLVRQIWEFLEGQLEIAESREMTVGRFVTAANEVTIGGFWREHAKGELKTRKGIEILKFLSPCWEKKYMAGVFYAKETIFGAFVQELLSMPINLLLAIYLIYPNLLFNMGPAYMFGRGVETLRIDTGTPESWRTGGVSSVNEIWGAPVNGKDTLKHRLLLVQVRCRTEDVASGVSSDAKPTHDRRGEES